MVDRAEVFDSIAGLGYADVMKYPGGKAGSGVYQRIVSQMPPHSEYVEPFLGGGAVMRMKRSALWNYGVDIDPLVVGNAQCLIRRDDWISHGVRLAFAGEGGPAFKVVCGEGVQYLRLRRWWEDSLVYCDPPYLMSTRSSQRRMYRYELDEPGHIALLDVAVRLPCMVMISGYPSKLYADRLSSWRVVRYRTMTRGGRMADECLWCNFPEPTELHDYRFLGRDFRERERIRRKCSRWVAMLSAMPVLERASVVAALSRPLLQGEVQVEPVAGDVLTPG